MGMSLTEIHRKKTGKVSDKWSSYLDFYDDKLWYLQDSKIKLLEIGVQNGGSLETWARYFWKAEKIVGIDIDPKCGDLKFEDQRIEVIVGDSKTVELEDKFDIIIDDGSHLASDIIANWTKWWPSLEDGGVYVVEDFHTMWMPGYGV
jgi:cephalosporin hydroxylase